MLRTWALIWIYCLLSSSGYSQTNCFQFTARPYNIIPNPSFEMDPASCRNGYLDQRGLKLPGWSAATDMILSGYLDACHNFLIPDTTVFNASATNTFLSLYPLVPQPVPDGNGVVAVSDYGFTKGTVHVYPKYASYVRTCLPVPLEKDSLFRFEFYAGFGDHGNSALDNYFNVELLPQISSSPEKFSLFGLEYCPATPDPILGCLSVPGWYLLGSVTVSGKPGTWVKASINFRAPANILALGLGPSCDTTFESDQGDFTFGGRRVSTNNYSYFLDKVQLYKANVPEPQLKQVGSSCDPSVKVELATAFYFSGYSIQWFKDGVLLPQTNDSFLIVNKSTHGEGVYQCLVQSDSICLLSNPLTVAWKNSPDAGALGSGDTLACNGDTVLLQIRGDSSFRYAWQDGSTLPYFAVNHEGSYAVTVTNECGLAEARKTIHYGKCNYDTYMPNAFTPNGDGHNDLFRIRYDYPPGRFLLTVMNRYGQRVFSTHNPAEGWDGNLGGAKQPAGTYVWMVEYTDHDQIRRARKGTVVLIR